MFSGVVLFSIIFKFEQYQGISPCIAIWKTAVYISTPILLIRFFFHGRIIEPPVRDDGFEPTASEM